MMVFGSVPSRRLGRSLGINHIPPKMCTYSCVYCQVGRTSRLRLRRSSLRSVESVVAAVSAKVGALCGVGEEIDYLSFVPDGEPTLEAQLGEMIRRLRVLGIPIAVLTNGSLLDREDVRADLGEADWVSLKVDAVSEAVWRRINRPHRALQLGRIQDGMRQFAGDYRGRLATETMLVADVNDGEAELRATASLVGELAPWTAYVAVPTRPPAEGWVRPASALAITRAYEVFRGLQGRVELLVDYEGDGFARTGDGREDLLAITAVHPMRARAAARLLEAAGADWRVAAELMAEGELVEVCYGGHRYLVRPPAGGRDR